jgi:hypothetical protein
MMTVTVGSTGTTSTTETGETGGRARRRADERVLGAGTTIRFALVVLPLVASGSMILEVVTYIDGTNQVGCLLASGGHPSHGAYLAESGQSR